MDDDPRLVTTATLVALAGGVLAFFALTNRGRDALRRVGPALDDVSHTLDEVRTVIQKIDRVVQEDRIQHNARRGVQSERDV